MPRTDTIVIGGGQAGLAVSRHLTIAGRDHVVLERGRVAESWRSRWDSLRLLTPNWMNHLPGSVDDDRDPHGFLAAADLVSVLERYADASCAPVLEQTAVVAVERDDRGWTVQTDGGRWRSHDVVVATGHCMLPAVPGMAGSVDPGIRQVSADHYRNPGQLPDGGVLVVGASATGTQLAEELARTGREVVLAVGDHTRMPRRYRGHDICTWLDELGMWDDHIDGHPDPGRATRSPSLQLVGSTDARDVDLVSCRTLGVQLAGRVVATQGRHVRFAPAASLERSVTSSERRLHRVLDRIDDHIARHRIDTADGPHRPIPPTVDHTADELDLRARGITSVLWATGHRRSYPWLPPAALDERGEIRHRHGIGALAGLYVVGLRFQRRRSSSFIGGVGDDARHVVEHLSGRGARPGAQAA